MVSAPTSGPAQGRQARSTPAWLWRNHQTPGCRTERQPEGQEARPVASRPARRQSGGNHDAGTGRKPGPKAAESVRGLCGCGGAAAPTHKPRSLTRESPAARRRRPRHEAGTLKHARFRSGVGKLAAGGPIGPWRQMPAGERECGELPNPHLSLPNNSWLGRDKSFSPAVFGPNLRHIRAAPPPNPFREPDAFNVPAKPF